MLTEFDLKWLHVWFLGCEFAKSDNQTMRAQHTLKTNNRNVTRNFPPQRYGGVTNYISDYYVYRWIICKLVIKPESLRFGLGENAPKVSDHNFYNWIHFTGAKPNTKFKVIFCMRTEPNQNQENWSYRKNVWCVQNILIIIKGEPRFNTHTQTLEDVVLCKQLISSDDGAMISSRKTDFFSLHTTWDDPSQCE